MKLVQLPTYADPLESSVIVNPAFVRLIGGDSAGPAKVYTAEGGKSYPQSIDATPRAVALALLRSLDGQLSCWSVADLAFLDPQPAT